MPRQLVVCIAGGLLASASADVAGNDYVLTTNENDASCVTPFGGYVNLADQGASADPTFAGDSIAKVLFADQNPIEFYGQPRANGITVTDDGFVVFDSGLGTEFYDNTSLPNPDLPNDMLAPFWSDWFLNYDDGSTSGRVRGLTAATFGPDVSIVEWDGMELWPGNGGKPIVADFEVIIYSTPDPDRPEFVFAYDNVDEQGLQGFDTPPTIGVENQTGTCGTVHTRPIYSGLLVCLNYVADDTDDDGIPPCDDPDDDNDGLTDLQENAIGTNPVNPDSDNDNLGDAEENANGTNPLDPDSDDDGIGDAFDTHPLAGDPPNNLCTSSDGNYATMAEPVLTDRSCAAKVSIDVAGETRVKGELAHLRLIAPTVTFQSGFIAEGMTVISADPCPGCSP